MKVYKSSLKILSGLVVTESKLPKDSKIQLLNFVQNEADAHQLMSLLVDGKVSRLTEDGKRDIESRFVNTEWAYAQEKIKLDSKKASLNEKSMDGAIATGFVQGVGIGVAGVGVALIAALAYAAIKGIRARGKKAKVLCEKLKSDNIRKCKLMVDVKMVKEMIAEVQKESTNCKKYNPEKQKKCYEESKYLVKSYSDHLKDLQEKLKRAK